MQNCYVIVETWLEIEKFDSFKLPLVLSLITFLKDISYVNYNYIQLTYVDYNVY